MNEWFRVLVLVLVLKEWSLTLRNNSGSHLTCAEEELRKTHRQDLSFRLSRFV